LGVKASELPRPYDGFAPTDDEKHAGGAAASTDGTSRREAETIRLCRPAQ
jgi:hypothetical protein